MKIRVLRSKVRIRTKPKKGGASAPERAQKPQLEFKQAAKINPESLQSQHEVEELLEEHPELIKSADPQAVANAVYDIMKREVGLGFSRGETQ